MKKILNLFATRKFKNFGFETKIIGITNFQPISNRASFRHCLETRLYLGAVSIFRSRLIMVEEYEIERISKVSATHLRRRLAGW